MPDPSETVSSAQPTTAESKHSSFKVIIWVGIVVVLLCGITFVSGVVAGPTLLQSASDQLAALPLVGKIGFVQQLEQQLSSHSSAGGNSKLEELMQQDQVSIPDVVEAASDSVVTIAVNRQQRTLEPLNGNIFNLGPFGMPMVPSQEKVEQVQQDIGTGFIVDSKSGLVVTNKHVVSDRTAEYTVFDKDNTEYSVTKIYRDPTNDLAIIQVEKLNRDPLPMGDSDSLRVGESAIAIGTALGEFRNTVTTGVISGLGRGITAGDGLSQSEELSGVIQTDAAINPGNSGGPLLNAKGEVIGVNVAVSEGANNIGFALPINLVKSVLDNFNATGQFERPFLGVEYQMISQQAALANDLPQGAYVISVVPGSAAEEAKLQAGDVITAIDGQDLKEVQLVKVIDSLRVGKTVTITYWRDGKSNEVSVTFKPAPEDR